MLDFLRRHQRYFFIFITIVVVISFSFFGTSKALRNGVNAPKTSPDKMLGRSVDGAPIMQRDVDNMVMLISFGEENISLAHSEDDLNFLTDAIITKDFLETGLGNMLANHYLVNLTPDLQARLTKMKKYHPYVHPQAPFLSAETIWKHFSPDMVDNFSELATFKGDVDENSFALISKFYLQQAILPPSTLKKLLVFHQNQYNWLSPDPNLIRGDLSLFGFRSLQDWFGRNFLEIVAQFLINASAIAEERGYVVTPEEARAQLFQNASQALCKIKGVNAIAKEEVEKLLEEKLSKMQMTEHDAVKNYRRIMLFKRMFNEYGNSVFLDELSYKKFAEYAEDGVLAEIYRLPEYLKLKDFRSMLKLQFYCDAVGSKNSGDYLALPFSAININTLKSKYPELVQRVFSVEYTKVSKHQLAQKVSLKQTWEWEIEDKNWNFLIQKFPVLGKSELKTKEEKFLFLESLDSNTRFKIDKAARFEIIGEHKEWIEEALEKAVSSREIINFRTKGGFLPFYELKDREALLGFLNSAPILEKLQHDADTVAKMGNLAMFSQDNENFYRIAVIEKSESDMLVAFAEAVKDGTLDKLLDDFLQEQYASVREKNETIFKDKNGNWKSFEEAKDKISAIVYGPLLKAIEDDYKNSGVSGSLASLNNSLDFYAHNRLFKYSREVKSCFESGEGSPSCRELSTDSKKTTLENLGAQWLFEKEVKKIKRADDINIDKESIFSHGGLEWSTLIEKNGEFSFFKVLERIPGECKVQDKIHEGERILSVEAKRHLMYQILTDIEERKAITIPVKAQDLGVDKTDFEQEGDEAAQL